MARKKRIYPNIWPYYRNTKCGRCLRPKALGRVHMMYCDECRDLMRWFLSARRDLSPHARQYIAGLSQIRESARDCYAQVRKEARLRAAMTR
jgi:hypothetical protein